MNQLKRIFYESLKIIRSEGFKKYLEHVKIKLRRRELYVAAPIKINFQEEKKLENIVKENKEHRLEIKNSIRDDISSDKISFPDDYYFYEDNLKPKTNEEIVICTIISSNYLAHDRTLADSFLMHNPLGRVFVLLVDKLDEKFVPKNEKFNTVFLEEIGIPDLDSFLFKYSIMEQNTDVKAHFLEYLLKKYSFKKIAYFDPDILFTNTLENLWKVLDEKSIVLTPHITSPIDDDRRPSELEFLQSGTYNLGFIALSNNQTTDKFLTWWQKHLIKEGYIDVQNGLFVDQKWVDLVPAIFEDVLILKHPGYNSAYWNLKGKQFEIKDGHLYVNDKPLYFFHFSGFSPENLEAVSKHQNRFKMKDLESLRKLFELYRDLLVENEFLKIKKLQFEFDYFDNKVKIPIQARRIFARQLKHNQKFGNPFSTKGEKNFFNYLNKNVDNKNPIITHLWYQFYKEREDLKSKYDDIFNLDRIEFIKKINIILKNEYQIDKKFLPSTLIEGFDDLESEYGLNEKSIKKIFKKSIKHEETGINIVGYFKGEFGVAEAARGYVRAIKSTEISHVLNNITSNAHRNEDKEFEDFEEDNPYPINLIAVNADQSKVFFDTIERDYYKNKYNIGIWFWEISNFPENFEVSFKYYDEIWVATSFVANALSKSSPIPIVKVPGPLDTNFENILPQKELFGLQDHFTFLFIFDFHSFMERKNPLGLIKAFKMAFKKNEKVKLVIKCTNADKFSQEFKKLKDEASDQRIDIISDYLSKKDLLSLIMSSDCYVSLHRSEGLGLTIADAIMAKKPVIATDYGGNTDFMNVNNSFPVKFKIIKLERDFGPYEKGNVWADPDIEYASYLMNYVFENQAEAKKIGEKGFEFLKENYNPEIVGNYIEQRIDKIKKNSF